MIERYPVQVFSHRGRDLLIHPRAHLGEIVVGAAERVRHRVEHRDLLGAEAVRECPANLKRAKHELAIGAGDRDERGGVDAAELVVEDRFLHSSI